MQRAKNDIFDKEFLTTAASNENVSPDEAKVGTNLETIDNLEILEPLIEQTQNQSNQINKAVESNVSKKKTFLIPQIALMYQRKARLFYLDNRELTNF